MVKRYNKNKDLHAIRYMEILRSLMLKLEMQKYRKILMWYFYGNFTSLFLTKFNVKLQSYKFLSNLS